MVGKGDAGPTTGGRCSGSRKVILRDRGEEPGSLGCWGDLAPLSQPWFSDLHNGNEQSTPIGDNSDDLMNLVRKQSNQGQKSTYCGDSLCIQHESRQNSPGVRKSGESESAWSEHGVGGGARFRCPEYCDS